MAEPSDATWYELFHFSRTTYDLVLRGLDLYESTMHSGLDVARRIPSLAPFLEDGELAMGPAAEELRRVKNERQFLTSRSTHVDPRFVTVTGVNYGQVRYYKALARLVLDHMQQQRDMLAKDPNVSRVVIATLDEKLRSANEHAGMGAFAGATPWPLLYPPSITKSVETPPAARPRPRATPSRIEIVDEELRRRCLDLLLQFAQEDQHERLDEVISNASRLLEVRLRAASKAADDCSGTDLAAWALKAEKDQPARIRVSTLPQEQDHAHLLFRGFFGFVRNSVHHRLIDTFTPERALQVLAMVDYLMFLIEAGTEARVGDDAAKD